jgi:hypothetical protein
MVVEWPQGGPRVASGGSRVAAGRLGMGGGVGGGIIEGR